MKHVTTLTVLMGAMTLFVGCGGGSSGDRSVAITPDPPVTPPSAPAPMSTDFTAFTRDLMSSMRTNDIDEPVDLESIEWAFTDDENEAAYDDIVAAPES